MSKFRRAFGSSLIISTEDTGEFKLTPDSTNLREGETLTISTNKWLDSADVWTWTVDGETKGTLNDTIEVEKTDSYITFTALPTGQNNNDSHYLVVTATSGNNTVSTDSILIQYVPVSAINITSETNIVSLDSETKLNVRVIPSNHTKSDLLSEKINWTINGGVVIGNFEDGYYWKQSATTDGELTLKLTDTVNLEGELITSNKLKFIYDKELVKIEGNSSSRVVKPIADPTKTSESLHWIWDVLFEAKGQSAAENIQSVKISTLKELDLNRYMSAIPSQINEVDVINDLEYLQYFNYSNNTFTIPNKFFTNLYVPEVNNISTVIWNLNDV